MLASGEDSSREQGCRLYVSEENEGLPSPLQLALDTMADTLFMMPN